MEKKITKQSVKYRKANRAEDKVFRMCLRCRYREVDIDKCKKLNQQVKIDMCCNLFIDKYNGSKI